MGSVLNNNVFSSQPGSLDALITRLNPHLALAAN